MSVFVQSRFEARFDWGEDGLRELGASGGTVVVVDVLSFSTAVDVALSRGAKVYPYRHGDETAADFAARIGAVLAVSRATARDGAAYSLSPVSLSRLQPGESVVLPSPNGSALSLLAAELSGEVLTGCLRNARAVAERARGMSRPICVIAAEERWRGSGGLRPAFEDLIGAGAILSELAVRSLSPEALAAIGAFQAAEGELERLLLDCASGRELVAAGFRDDVLVASELNVSGCVPRLVEGCFTDAQKPAGL